MPVRRGKEIQKVPRTLRQEKCCPRRLTLRTPRCSVFLIADFALFRTSGKGGSFLGLVPVARQLRLIRRQDCYTWQEAPQRTLSLDSR